MIKATCLVLHHHICEGCAMSWPIDPLFNIFNDPAGMEAANRSSANGGGVREIGGRMRVSQEGMHGWGGRRHQERPPPSYAEVRRHFFKLLVVLVLVPVVVLVLLILVCWFPK